MLAEPQTYANCIDCKSESVSAAKGYVAAEPGIELSMCKRSPKLETEMLLSHPQHRPQGVAFKSVQEMAWTMIILEDSASFKDVFSCLSETT